MSSCTPSKNCMKIWKALKNNTLIGDVPHFHINVKRNEWNWCTEKKSWWNKISIFNVNYFAYSKCKNEKLKDTVNDLRKVIEKLWRIKTTLKSWLETKRALTTRWELDIKWTHSKSIRKINLREHLQASFNMLIKSYEVNLMLKVTTQNDLRKSGYLKLPLKEK